MDDGAARLPGEASDTGDHAPDRGTALIPGQIPGQIRGAGAAPADAAPPPGPVPGAYAWVPVQRAPLVFVPPRGPFPYRHPDDVFGVWPDAVADPRRDRQTTSIVVSSLLAAVLVAILTVTQIPDATGGARTLTDAAAPETTPDTTDGDAPAGPGGSSGPGPETGTGTADPDGDGPGAAPGKAPELKGPTASASARNSVLTRTQAVAGARGGALARNDAEAFVAGVDKNNKALVDGERRVFANLRKVPFDESAWNADKVSDARTESGAKNGWPVLATVEVAFRHKIQNVDVRPVAERYIWTVRCPTATDPCHITHIAGAKDSALLGPAGYPAPWDLWDLVVERRPHVVVFGPAAALGDLRTRADEAEAAAVYDLRTWTGPAGTSPGFALTLTRERKTFEGLYSSESPGDWAAGFALPLVSAADSDTVGGSRVVIDLTEMDQDPAFAKVILRHEMVHALLDPLTRADYQSIPLWAAEGFADWVAQADRSIRGTYEARAVSTQIQQGTFKGTLPRDADFSAEDEDVIDAAYNQSHLALRYLAETYGPEKACAFIADVYQGKSGNMDGAVRAATGKSLAEFEKAWADWTRQNFG